MRERTVEVGQRFRETGLGLFDRRRPAWTVERVYVGTDGVEHAVIAMDGAADIQKTISVAVLFDRERFETMPR